MRHSHNLAHAVYGMARALVFLVTFVCLVLFLALNPVRVVRVGVQVWSLVVDMVENVASGKYRGH